MNSPYNGKFKVTQEFKGAAVHDGLDLVGIDSKEVHAVVAGTVSYAGWENPSNHSQGFGQYVSILAPNGDKWYYGHLSQINVKVGQAVKVTDIVGIEGSTGRSTGSHCHCCVRPNGVKANAKNVATVLGIPNALGIYDDNKTTSVKTDTIDVIYNVFSNKKWWGAVTNWNDVNSNGYAGVKNYAIRGLSAKSSKGVLEYRVQGSKSGWFGWIKSYNTNDWINGVAGSQSEDIIGIQFRLTGVTGYNVRYRCSIVGQDKYLPWVVNYDNTSNGYAGIGVSPIDCVQVEIVKA